MAERKQKPKVSWIPAPIKYGVPLDRTHFNAEATFEGKSIRGNFRYSYQEGDILPLGKQRLKVIFDPEDGATHAVVEEVVEVYCKATLVFSSLKSATIPYGTATTTLSGAIAATIESIGTLIPPTTERVSITLNGVTKHAPIGADGHFSFPFDTSALEVSDSPYAIIYRYAGSDFFDPAIDDTGASLGVTKATPTFSNLTESQKIPYRTETITVSGKLTAPTATPQNTDSVTVSINGTSVSQTVFLSGGAFSATLTTATIPASATGYTISYSFAGDSNFKSARDTSTSLMVTWPYLISGLIKTRTGVVVPGYTVKLVDLRTYEIVYEAMTESDGSYHIPCGEGSYKIVVGKKEVVVPIPAPHLSDQAGA